jgi:hypothetical protein
MSIYYTFWGQAQVKKKANGDALTELITTGFDAHREF